MHQRMFGGGLLPACLRLSDSMEGAAVVAHEAAATLMGTLRLPAQLVDLLASCRCEGVWGGQGKGRVWWRMKQWQLSWGR